MTRQKLITNNVSDKPNPKLLSDAFLQAAEYILCSELAAIIYTDIELIFLINERLAPEYQVSDATFMQWKALIRNNQQEDLPEMAKLFKKLVTKYMLIQKKELFKMYQSDIQWQKWAWIIERRFADWNIKHQVNLDISPTAERKALVELSDAELNEEIKKLENALLPYRKDILAEEVIDCEHTPTKK